MNIHTVAVPRGYKPRNTAMAPRHRVGLDTNLRHNAYPGGKHYRKAMAKLHLRIEGTQDGKRPDRITDRDGATPWGKYGLTKPGSLK